MKYQGGKGRIARRLVDVIIERAPEATRWVEPFVGGAWVLERADATGRFDELFAGDVVPDLILAYQAVAIGWNPPTTISREEYERLRHEEPSALRGVAGFGSAYGGVWFTGYCGDAVNGTRTNAQIAADHLTRRRPLFQKTELRLCDYTAWEDDIDEHTAVYCDPPYANTIGYKSKGRADRDFDSEAFWAWCSRMASERGAHVFVSEYTGPEWAESVWERTAKQTVSAATWNHTVTEHLYHLSPDRTTHPGNQRGTTMNYPTYGHQPPSVADFFAQPTEPDDVEEPLTIGQNTLWRIPDDPMERVAAALERVVEVLTTLPPYVVGQGQTPAADRTDIAGHTDAIREDLVQVLSEALADSQDEAEVMAKVIADVDAALGKSKAAPALAAKAVIEAWRKGPAEPVEETEPTALSDEEKAEIEAHLEPEGWTPPETLDAEQVLRLAAGETGAAVAPMPGPPAHDASVTDWRSYARRAHGIPAGEASVFDTMNRSQVRTALGISQPVEGGA